jgi:hypothetical protein
MKKHILLLIISCIAKVLPAQFSDSVTYYTGLNATGTYNKTNDGGELYNFNNAAKLSVRKKSVSLNSNTKWVYGQQSNVLTNNDFSSALDFNLYKSLPHFYYWGLANYTSSYSLKQNHQLQGGLGLAYNIIDKTTAYLNLSDGLIYEYSDVILNDSTNQIYDTWRNSLRLSFRWDIRNRVFVNGVGYFQHSLNYGDDYIIRSDLSLGIRLKKWLSLTTALSYNKVSKTQRENLLLTYGLLIEKYF